MSTATHAIGDAAVRHVLDSVEKARTDGPGGVPAAVRHRVEHGETVPDDTVRRFAPLGVAASMQPTHCCEFTRADHSGSARPARRARCAGGTLPVPGVQQPGGVRDEVGGDGGSFGKRGWTAWGGFPPGILVCGIGACAAAAVDMTDPESSLQPLLPGWFRPLFLLAPVRGTIALNALTAYSAALASRPSASVSGARPASSSTAPSPSA
ncbi:hypothetical protein ADK64_39605 [Streptomyces sp. MMG1121]|nr:hypothetical protein ADK64_39605 [Streptomyces sp. MMG1121]